MKHEFANSNNKSLNNDNNSNLQSSPKDACDIIKNFNSTFRALKAKFTSS